MKSDTVKCCNCEWTGADEDLTLFETKGDGTETITAEENSNGKITRYQPAAENPFFFKGCPNCKTDGYLMDIELENTVRKHTPGKWEASKTINDYAIYSDTNESKDIAAVYQNSRSIPKEEAQANAKLIAAAPDMLEALQAVERWLNGEENEFQETVIQAIRKATD